MQFSYFFALLSIISYAVALPIPVPGVITVVHTAPTSTVLVKSTTTVTTTIPIVRVLISNGVTYTSTLTTIYTAVSGDDVNKGAIPSTLYSTINFDTTASVTAPAPAQNNFVATTTTPIVEADAATSSAEAPAATTSDVTTSSTEAPTAINYSTDALDATTSDITSSSTETTAVTTSDVDTPSTEAPAATTSNVTSSSAEAPAAPTSDVVTSSTESSTATTSDLTTSSTEAPVASSSDLTTSSTEAPVASSSDLTTSSTEAPVASSLEVSTSSNESSSPATISIYTEATSNTVPSSTETTSSSESETLQITTLPNGETFIASLADKLVSATNVAPIFAVTTITASSGQTGSADASLSVTTLSNGQVLLGTLTEGLGHDTNVAANLANPGTVSVTNTAVTTTPVATTSSSTVSTSTTTSSTATSTGSSDYLSAAPSAIVYSPYQDDGSCKTYATILSDITLIQSKGIGELRIYGNDCNYLTSVLPIANGLGLKVNQGFWISSAGVDSIDDAVSNFITYMESGAASYDWDLFSFITVGNEAIISDYCSVSDLISKISSVKSLLNAAGYTGLITTSEPPVSFENNPELCTESEIDFVGINPHAYFDTYSTAETAGTFVKGQIALVSQYCGGKSIRVTETGYPSAGIQNGGNIPSAANQKIALQNIFDVAGTEITVLTTYNDYWKEPGSYGIEQSFGMIQLLE